jgi:hypothetical protein
MAKYTFEEAKQRDKIAAEVARYAQRLFPSFTGIKVEQDMFKEWFVTIRQDPTVLFTRRFNKWVAAIRYFEDENQPAPTVGQQLGLF